MTGRSPGRGREGNPMTPVQVTACPGSRVPRRLRFLGCGARGSEQEQQPVCTTTAAWQRHGKQRTAVDQGVDSRTLPPPSINCLFCAALSQRQLTKKTMSGGSFNKRKNRTLPLVAQTEPTVHPWTQKSLRGKKQNKCFTYHHTKTKKNLKIRTTGPFT